MRVDDFFLHYLQKVGTFKPNHAMQFCIPHSVSVAYRYSAFFEQESTLVEIHRAFGTDYKTVAACQLKFRDLLEKPHGRIHSTAKLIGGNPVLS